MENLAEKKRSSLLGEYKFYNINICGQSYKTFWPLKLTYCISKLFLFIAIRQKLFTFIKQSSLQTSLSKFTLK
jgi:hypothetical protein